MVISITVAFTAAKVGQDASLKTSIVPDDAVAAWAIIVPGINPTTRIRLSINLNSLCICFFILFSSNSWI